MTGDRSKPQWLALKHFTGQNIYNGEDDAVNALQPGRNFISEIP
ncbi:hypothetical protein [Blastomonas aquatica]|nr:hypothetical protein [Blastomonas aquatica]